MPEADAEDALQDTLVRLHEGADSLRHADRAEAWVFSIARRTIADFYRERERGPEEQPMGRGAEPVDDEVSSTENLAGCDGDHDVHEKVLSWLRPMADELPEKYRHPLLVADFEGHTHREVADEHGLSRSGLRRGSDERGVSSATGSGSVARSNSVRRGGPWCFGGARAV